MIETRAEQIQLAKEQALNYLNSGKPVMAIASMVSNLRRHPETINHRDLPTLSKLALKHPIPIAEIRQRIQGFS